MRGAIAVVIAGAMCGSAWAQEIVEIPYAPGVGTQWALEEVLTKSRTDENGGVQTTVGTMRGVLSIERETPSGFEGTWTTESVEAGGVVLNSANGGEFLIGVPLGLSLDRDGAPSAVRDWPSVLQRIIDAVARTQQDPDQRVLDAIQRMYASWTPEMAASLLFKNLAAVSVCQGVADTPGIPVEAEGMMQSGLGGQPILVRERFELVSVDRDRGIAHMRYSQTLDPESAAASLREGMRRLAEQTGRPLDEVTAQFEGGLTHTTTVSCETDLATGVPRSVTSEVQARTGPAEQVERREITMRRRT